MTVTIACKNQRSRWLRGSFIEHWHSHLLWTDKQWHRQRRCGASQSVCKIANVSV